MTNIVSSRRTFLTGLGLALVAAPAIVRSGVIMPVKNMLILPDEIGDITVRTILSLLTLTIVGSG